MIVCEKPLCKNSVEAEQLTKKITDAGVVFVLNYQRRFFSLFHSVHRELSQGRIGRTQQVTCYYSNGLYNNAGHLLDAIMFLLEERERRELSMHLDVGAGAPNDGPVRWPRRSACDMEGYAPARSEGCGGDHDD